MTLRATLFVCGCKVLLSASAQLNIDSMRMVAYDLALPDSVRLQAMHDLVWDGYLFSDPDSAYVLGCTLRQHAQRMGQGVHQAQASSLIAATWYVSERAREASEVRTRIAMDVHDQLGSDLTKLVLLSGEMKEIAAGDASITGTAADIERVAGEANRSLGDIVWAIDPHHDSLAGLTERVRANCERMLNWSHIPHTIACEQTGPDRTLDPATKRDIYLMLREALNNVIKYAKATHIVVRFHTSVDSVVFEVQDAGVGMSAANGNGHGLENMKHGPQRVGGTLDFQSSAGQGTRITFRGSLGAP